MVGGDVPVAPWQVSKGRIVSVVDCCELVPVLCTYCVGGVRYQHAVHQVLHHVDDNVGEGTCLLHDEKKCFG